MHKRSEIKNQITQLIRNKTGRSEFSPSPIILYILESSEFLVRTKSCDSQLLNRTFQWSVINKEFYCFYNIYYITALMCVGHVGSPDTQYYKAVIVSKTKLSGDHVSRVMLFKHLRHSTKLCASQLNGSKQLFTRVPSIYCES